MSFPFERFRLELLWNYIVSFCVSRTDDSQSLQADVWKQQENVPVVSLVHRGRRLTNRLYGYIQKSKSLPGASPGCIMDALSLETALQADAQGILAPIYNS